MLIVSFSVFALFFIGNSAVPKEWFEATGISFYIMY